MFRRNILNILLLLILCFVISCSNKSRYQFSKKYSPIYNPDGEAFYSNVEFARDYSIYKEHRDALISGTGKNSKNVNIKRKEKSKVWVDNKEYEASLERVDHDFMIDSNGINLVDVASAKFVDPIEDNDGIHIQNVKDKNEVKLPVAKTENKGTLQDVKDKNEVKLPVAKTENKGTLQDVKDKNEVKLPVAKTENKGKLQDVEDKNEVKLPVAKTENKGKLQDVKDKNEIKLPIAKTENKGKLQDVKDKNEINPLMTESMADNLSDNGSNQTDKKDKGLRSLLKFSKIESNKDENSNGDSENRKDNIDSDKEPVLSQSRHDVESSKLISEENEQKNNYKAVHFLSFLKEQNKNQDDTAEELQKAENKNDQDDSVKDNAELSEQNSQINIDNNGIMSKEEKDHMLLQRIKEMKEYDEDYSITTYYYNDQGMAYYEE